MNELAFNAEGESFEVPATVTGWRVRRMKPRGVAELVYGKDGRPLTIDVATDAAELRELIGFAGKYRLEPVNEAGKRVDNVPAAYIKLLAPERPASDAAFHEAMRTNTELARSVIETFSAMTSAAAELLRASSAKSSASSSAASAFALTPTEAVLAHQLASQLAPSELHAWVTTLSGLPAPAAVAKIRELIESPHEARSAS